MIIGGYDDNALLKFVTDFYMLNACEYNFLSYINLIITDDIMQDYKNYKHNKSLLTEAMGIAILPDNPNEKINILFSMDDIGTEVIMHELTHAYDFIEFSKIYCDSKLYEAENHHLYQTLVYWSEFHVKLFDIPYAYILFSTLQNDINTAMSNFARDISSHYYTKFTEKMLSKIPHDVQMRDIMWYLGELVVCNLYDKNNEYSIDPRVISEYPFVTILYDVLKNCLDIQSFAHQSKLLKLIFEG